MAQSYNEARLEPRSDRHQAVLASRVEVDPSTRVVRHVDYWGSVVHHFDIQVPHQSLTVVGRATVETGTELAQPGEATWDELRDPVITDQFEELLVPTADGRPGTTRSPTVAAELAGDARHPGRRGRGGGRPGSTSGSTTARGAPACRPRRRRSSPPGPGVCQDFAHVNLALLRAMGIPSWYVSGYLHPDPKAEIDDVIVGESHAWVAAFTGTVWPLDPTSLNPVAERHVRVAAGRDYHDVAPFRGIYAGRADQELEVTVELVRKA